LDPANESQVSTKFIKFLKKACITAPVICDIGSRDAIEGIHLYKALSGRKLPLFEPNPAAAIICRQNLNRFCNQQELASIFFNQLGVTDRNGVEYFYPVNPETSDNGDIGFSSFLMLNPRYMKRRGLIKQDRLEVTTVTLDSYFANQDPPDILWIDVEGSELRVLQGASATLSKAKIIHIEVSFRAMHVGKPLFWEIDSFLRKSCFSFQGFIEVSAFKSFFYRHRLFPNLPWRLNALYCRY
jgi:FkbM family methyltransferase